EIGTQPWQRDGQRGTIDEHHRGCEHARGKHHATTPRRYLPPKLLACNNAATARLLKRLRHCFSQGALISAEPAPVRAVYRAHKRQCTLIRCGSKCQTPDFWAALEGHDRFA